MNYIIFAGDARDEYRYADEQGWWINQIDQIASSYCEWQFNAPKQEIDYNNYRTIINLTGGKEEEIISRKQTQFRGWSMEWHAHTC